MIIGYNQSFKILSHYIMSNHINFPQKIYLNISDESVNINHDDIESVDPIDYQEMSEITWSEDRINQYDKEYVDIEIIPKIMEEFLNDIRDFAGDIHNDDRSSGFFVKIFLEYDEIFGLNNLNYGIND